MIFFAILLALMLEQARPLSRDNPAHSMLRSWSSWSRQALDAGQLSHGWLAWGLAVLAPALAAAGVFWLLSALHFLLGFVWLVVVLYLTLGFRQFSHHFTAIRVALESGDEAGARAALARWKKTDTVDVPRSVFLQQVIEYSALSAHRHVFGVVVCFVVFAALGLGPAGAVAYRLAEHVSRRWVENADFLPEHASHLAARSAWHWVDYLPVRVTALVFAVVGHFEEAIANWRQEGRVQSNDALLLAATAGAMNVRLNEPGVDGADQVPQLAHLASVVGLVWRSVLFWLVLLALGMIARLI
ncbi:MAG: regulatory signaling modulator protein AmpE [Burkholderiaceae bacterium]|nr:regulatory signaling modulator protein AmpE [Burkholderiaceae bacterium]